MAEIKKPKSRKKGIPPKIEDASQNLTKAPDQELKPLNFKVSAEFKHDFKLYALEHDMSMVELLAKCFESYKRSL
jgi:hypothetical protein